MKYEKIMLLLCMSMCILFTVSCVFANDVTNETIGVNDLDGEELQVYSGDVNGTDLKATDSLSSSTVYFDASASSDGDGSKTNPYKVYTADRINYGTTAYFADGVYDITEVNSIHSSSTYKTTFIGQSVDKTILKSKLTNKFDFTVTDNSYFVLNDLTMTGVHINNQANLIAKNVAFRDGETFNTNYQPSLSYSYISKVYDSTYGGVIICDTPFNKVTTLNLTDCSFKGNAATSGGVIATYNSIANLQNCVFYNSSANRFGGAIYSIKSKLTISGSSFELNNAKYGGAIYVNSSTLNLKNSDFSKSQANIFGGVIASYSSQIDVNNVDFTDFASLDDAGGAIYATWGTLKVVDSTFTDGSSDFGGAICILKTDATISASQFTNNHAAYYGGSIYNMYGKFTLSGNTFTNTHASSGGTIFNRLSDSFNVANNRFTNSTADEGDIIFIDGDKVNVVQNGNTYDNSKAFLKYGNIYDIDYYQSVPVINYDAQAPDELPASYDSRKYGYITPAKDQIQGGNCWAFSGIATLEACIKKATGVDYDFSEENVKNLMSEYSLFDSDNGVNSGGNLYMFIAYLVGWFGPTYEVNDLYDDYSSLSVIYDSLVHVQNVYILPERVNFFDNDYIKRAVMEYGAVSIAIDLSETQGHAVTIVGWDDEFASNDFLGNKAVGAWIIKNSWGQNWGYNGFGYLSYEQPIGFGYTFIFDDDRGFTDIYQYDFAGKSGFHAINNSEVYIKNKFTANGDELLSAFSTYFDEPTNFTATIYVNGKQVATKSGASEKGYYTIPLDKEISLKKGDTFEISIKFFNGAPVYIPICEADGINKINFDKGISYYSVDGVHWSDLYESNTPGVACIKAFTRSNAMAEISIDEKQFASVESQLSKVNVDDVISIPFTVPQYVVVDGVLRSIDGLLTFKINDEYYYARVDNGKAWFNVTFDKAGKYDVAVQFKSNREVSNVVDFNVNVVKIDESQINIMANDVSKFYGGSEKFSATLSNQGTALSGVNVKITVNGKTYTLKTDSNGRVVLDLDLPVGTYQIYTEYGGKKVSSKFTVLTTIGTEDITQDFLDTHVSASFLNTDGNVLKNKKVTFSVSYYGVKSVPIQYNATIDNVGVATAKINLYTGKYSISVVNPINNEQKEFILDIVQIDSKCSLSVTQSGTSVVINATISPIQTSGYVNFIVLGKVYKVKVNVVKIENNHFAVASLRLDNMAVGSYDVTATFTGDDNLRVSSDTRTFSVTKNPYKLQSNNYWSYYGDAGTIAKITDANNKPVKGELVYATIDNKTYSAKTDDEGNAVFNLDLEVGNYSVLFEYKGQLLLKYVFVYSTIDIVTTSAEYMNSNIGAYFAYPHEGEQPESFNVKFIIAGKEYAATTDKNGYASIKADLPVGTHTVTAVNLCNGEKKQTKVKIYKTTPTLTLTKTKRGDGLLFTAGLTQTSAIGNVVFTMGTRKYVSPVREGKAILALNVLDEGSYEIYANYIGDTNFNNILSPTMKFDYAHTNYSLSAPMITKYYGGAEKFKVTLKNYNNPVSGEIINVTVDDKYYGLKTGSNGVAIFDNELNPGNHIVHCSYDDIPILSEITVRSTINILDAVADVSKSKMRAELTDANGIIIKNKVVSFKIGSNEYNQTTNSLGVATLEPNLNKGTYTVAIVNPVTGETRYSTLEITKSTPTLTLSTVKIDGADVLKAVLPKDATGDVDFVLDNGLTYTYELTDGTCILEGLDPGNYKVNVKYYGDSKYNEVSKSTSYKVSAIVAHLEIVSGSTQVSTTYGVSKTIKVSLKDSQGNILVGRTVTLNINNKQYTVHVASDGIASISTPTSLAPKTYAATITYAGETNIQGKTVNVNVVVKKATPKLTAAKKTFKLKDKTKKYVVTLKTNKNKVYKNKKVTIKVKGKTYTAKTNSKGQATFKLTKLTKKGTFAAVVKFSGNGYYKAVTKKVKIKVK